MTRESPWEVVVRIIILALAGALAAVIVSAQTSLEPAPRPVPYSLPSLLRSVAPASVLRVDQTLAVSDGALPGTTAHTTVTSVLATYRASPRWVPVFRQSWVRRGAFSNPLLGASLAGPIGGAWRASGFLATTIPVGSGGGDHPDPKTAAAIAAAVPARSAMDNALFAVNYWTLIGGADVARVTPGLTLQAEATVFQLTRVRGPETQDARRTNFTAGVHAGHFFTPRVSFGAEVRLQRWMTDAAPVRRDAAAREQLTFALGPRLHLKLGRHWLRPGLSYTRALDAPMTRLGYDVLQLDVPVSF